MPAAIIGGAIAAVGGIGSAVISSRGASRAAQATQAAADQSSQVQQQMYAQNAAALAPWQRSGMQANGAINSLLGIGGASNQPAQMPANALEGGFGGGDPSGGFGDSGMVNDMWGGPQTVGGDILGGNTPGLNSFGGGYGLNGQQQPDQQQQYQTAFDNYRNSTGYKFRLGEGMNAVNSGWAGAGVLQSGAALKAANDYGQGMASQEFGNYLNALGNQQSLGFSAASAQAGVGQNYANNISNIAMQNGANQANSALVRSQNTANALGGIANIAGNLYGRYG
jgi:hypothetical protein